MRGRRLLLPMLAALAAGSACGAAEPAPRRLALVIGEARYAAAGECSRCVAQAELAADTLRKAGWDVRPLVKDVGRADLERALAEFAAALKPGDAALVWWSGLSAKGPPTEAGEGTENYLLPIDATPKAVADLPKAGVALSSVAARLPSASAKVLVVDASRATLPEGEWNQPFGLAEPTNKAFVDAFVVFPAGLNRIAAEGRFTYAFREVLLTEPNLTATALFRRVGQMLAETSKGAQTPWAAGASRSARLVLNPQGGAAMNTDRDTYDQAVACGTRSCLQAAMGQVVDAKLKMDLMVRAAAATDAPAAPAALAANAKVADKLGATEGMSYLEGVIEANKDDAAGASLIGQNFLYGRGGFPQDKGQAYIHLIRAATMGDAEANYLFGVSMHKSGPLWPRKDWYGAMQHFKKAAEAGHPGGEYYFGLYQFAHDYPAQQPDPRSGMLWLTKAAAAGEPRAKAIVGDPKALAHLLAGELPPDW